MPLTKEEKSQVMKLSWKYRRAGMNPSESMKKAHMKVEGKNRRKPGITGEKK